MDLTSPAGPRVGPFQDARRIEDSSLGRRNVALVAHTPFWMFEHGKELRRRGWDVSLFTATPWWMIDPAVANRVHVRLGWATWSQALRRLARYGLYPPKSCFDWMERRARPQLAAWVRRRLDGASIVDALSSWGVEVAQAIHRHGGRYVCSRGSSHILFQRTILAEEFARWGWSGPGRLSRLGHRA